MAIAGTAVLAAAGLVAIPSAAYAAPGCAITYDGQPWVEGSGFGGFNANITIQNTGDPISGWTLAFTLPSGQTRTGGWSATWTGTTSVTATNLDWNRNLATGASTTIGIQGRWTGAYTNPTAFTVNGTSCGGGGQNQPPTVSITSPAPNQSFPVGSTIALAANASDPGGAVTRVEFRVDGNLVGTDTTSPYTGSVGNLSSGPHTAMATAFDNGNPVLSASASVSFSVGTIQPSIIVAPGALALNGGASGTVNVRLSAFTANVTATVARTGSTALTCTPTSIAFTSSNWQNGVNLTCTAAAGTAAATSTFNVTAPGHTAASFTVSRNGPGKVDNPYSGATVYNNPDWRARAMQEPGGNRIANQPTGVWMDRRAAINGTTGARGLASHLDEAVIQDNANGSAAMVIQIVIYNLPGRDCAALASNGELGETDLPIYRTQYIDPIAEIFSRSAYANLRIVAIIEIDSIPNLVTNVAPRETQTDKCNRMLANGGYIQGVGYALGKLGALPNVYNYIDAAHHGWIGWDDNFGATADRLGEAAIASGVTNWASLVHGFITNTANTSALTEQFVGPITEQLRQTDWIDFNRYNEELAFAQAFRNRLVQEGFSSNIGMLIDTSRNGWGNCVVAPCAGGGATRPTAPSSSTDPNTFVNQSRIDRRIHKGNWCNQAGAGLGERPRAAPAAGIDAYVWIKPPGESDGSSRAIPNDEGKGWDRMCDETYEGNARNGFSFSGALPNSPLSGHWFSAQFQQLMANAFPPLS